MGVVHAHAGVGDDRHGDVGRQRALHRLRAAVDRSQALGVGVFNDAGVALIELRQPHHADHVDVVDLAGELGLRPQLFEAFRVLDDVVGDEDEHRWPQHRAMGADVVDTAEEGLAAKAAHQRAQYRKRARFLHDPSFICRRLLVLLAVASSLRAIVDVKPFDREGPR